MALTADDRDFIKACIEPLEREVASLKRTTERIQAKVDNGTFVRTSLHESCQKAIWEDLKEVKGKVSKNSGVLVKILIALAASGVLGGSAGVGIVKLLGG